MLFYHLGDFLRVGIAEPEVDALVILGDVVEVTLGVAFLVPVALDDLGDVTGAKHRNLKVERGRLQGVLVKACRDGGPGRERSHGKA